MSASPSRIKNSRLSTAPLPSGSKTHHTASTICRMFRSEGMSAPSPKVLTRARTTSSFSSSPLPSSSQYSNHSLGRALWTAVEAAHDVPSLGSVS